MQGIFTRRLRKRIDGWSFGMVIDENLSWNEHISELKLNYVNKLNLVKTSRFLPTSVLLDLYFKVILDQSVLPKSK